MKKEHKETRAVEIKLPWLGAGCPESDPDVILESMWDKDQTGEFTLDREGNVLPREHVQKLCCYFDTPKYYFLYAEEYTKWFCMNIDLDEDDFVFSKDTTTHYESDPHLCFSVDRERWDYLVSIVSPLEVLELVQSVLNEEHLLCNSASLLKSACRFSNGIRPFYTAGLPVPNPFDLTPVDRGLILMALYKQLTESEWTGYDNTSNFTQKSYDIALQALPDDLVKEHMDLCDPKNTPEELASA